LILFLCLYFWAFLYFLFLLYIFSLYFSVDAIFLRTWNYYPSLSSLSKTCTNFLLSFYYHLSCLRLSLLCSSALSLSLLLLLLLFFLSLFFFFFFLRYFEKKLHQLGLGNPIKIQIKTRKYK
jgi:hypothetical protein